MLEKFYLYVFLVLYFLFRAYYFCEKFFVFGSADLDKFVIKGGKRLNGKVEISGAKNAAVAILPAVLLADSPCVIENVPDISDVNAIFTVLKQLGAKVDKLSRTTYEIDPSGVRSYVVTKEMSQSMRASSWISAIFF